MQKCWWWWWVEKIVLRFVSTDKKVIKLINTFSDPDCGDLSVYFESHIETETETLSLNKTVCIVQ